MRVRNNLCEVLCTMSGIQQELKKIIEYNKNHKSNAILISRGTLKIRCYTNMSFSATVN